MKKVILKALPMLTFFLWFSFQTALSQTNYYVDSNRPDNSGDGLSPSTAKKTIQAAIDISSDNDIINVANGTYNLSTSVTINKEVTLLGNNNNLAAKPIISGTGNSTSKALFEVNASSVEISNFEFDIDQTSDAMIGISSLSNDNFDNLKIADNVFKGMKPYSSGSVWSSYAIKLGKSFGVTDNKVTIVRNNITYNNMVAPELFGRGICAYNVYGKIGGSVSDANSLIAVYALQAGEIGGGLERNFEFSYNQVIAGVLGVVGAEVGFHNISHNIIGSNSISFAQAQNIVRFCEIRGSTKANAHIDMTGNIFNYFANIALFIQRSNNISLEDNIFNPHPDAGNTNFYSIVFSSKEGTSGTQVPVTSDNLSIKGNIFNSNGSTVGGTGIAFLNHNASASLEPLTNAVIGGTGNDKNIFNSDLNQYISLDQTPNGTTTGAYFDKLYDVTQDPSNTTNILPFNSNINASYNSFGAVDTETSTDFNDLVAVKAKISDGVDNTSLGYVNIQVQKAFANSLTDFNNATVTVPDDFTIILKNDPTIYENLGDATFIHAHTVSIDQYSAGDVKFNNLTVNAALKEVKFSHPTIVNGAFNLSAGKLTPLSTLTLNSTVSTTADINNFINGNVKVNNVASDILFPVGKSNKAAYIALTSSTGTSSSFNVEYFPAAHIGSTLGPGLTSVSSHEYWTITRNSGTLNAKVKVTSFDLNASGLTIPALTDAVVAQYSTLNSRWETMQNASYAAGNPNYVVANTTSTDFGDFTFGSNTTVLPVKLVSFTAKAKDDEAIINWSLNSTKALDKFLLEKSIDGKNFASIYQANAINNITQFEYIDKEFNTSAYYRLSQIDLEGNKTTYHDLTRYVNHFNESFSVVSYPNPVKNKLYINLPTIGNEKIRIILTDLTGKTLKVKDFNNSNDTTIDISDLNRGSFLIKIIKNSGNVSQKVLKL